MKTKTSLTRNSISRSPLRRSFLLIRLALALVWLALSPTTRAVDPPPDGGYPNRNTAEGEDALFSLDTSQAFDNTAIGFQALYNDVGSEFLGLGNTAIGSQALFSNTTGNSNTAIGNGALFTNSGGGENTANGSFALVNNTTGFANTATGSNALQQNTTGQVNTAIGYLAMQLNTTGSDNTAIGFSALLNNRDGDKNTAIGAGALGNNASGINNTATGFNALTFNLTGRGNAANGFNALLHNTDGNFNTASGFNALGSNSTGSDNIALGTNAGSNLTTGSGNIDIGNKGVAGEANTIRIGNKGTQTATFIAGIGGATVPRGIGVIVDSTGHLGTVVSSERYKDNIKPMDKASEAILALRPVTFRYKHDLDPDGIPQFGLVAEQVEKVSPDLVARDEQGKPYTVRYEAVNAMLLNEFLKEHRKVERLEKQVEALTAGLQKVSAQLELSKAASQTALNNQ